MSKGNCFEQPVANAQVRSPRRTGGEAGPWLTVGTWQGVGGVTGAPVFNSGK